MHDRPGCVRAQPSPPRCPPRPLRKYFFGSSSRRHRGAAPDSDRGGAVADGAGGEVPPRRGGAPALAVRLRVSADDCSGDDALHPVVCCSLERGGRREDVDPGIRMLLKDLAPAVPPLLRERARIRHFDVFVTTAIDPLLAQAPGEARFPAHPARRAPSRWPLRRTARAVWHRRQGRVKRRRCFHGSAACRGRRTLSSAPRTGWNFSPRCRRSRSGPTCSSTGGRAPAGC